MGIIPPPVIERPRRSIWSIVSLVIGLCMLAVLAVTATLVFLGYSRLDAPPAEAAAKRTEAGALFEAQQETLAAARERAGSALEEGFDHVRVLQRWSRSIDAELRVLFRDLLVYPEGWADDHWIVHADRAAQSEEWPAALDPGRHGLDTLRRNAAAWLLENEDYRQLVTGVRHDLAWRPRNAAEDEYDADDPYLDAVHEFGIALALSGLAAARDGNREEAWEHLELLGSLGHQLLQEPESLAAVAALTMQFHADIVLWSVLDDGPLTDAERARHEAIGAIRADSEPLRALFGFEAALAHGRSTASGYFPRLARRVLFDRFWDEQQALIDALDEPPHETAGSLRTGFRSLPVYADESSGRLRRNLYLYRVHWQSRFAWELAGFAGLLKEWKAAHGAYPVSLEELIDAGVIDGAPIDPVWGEPIHYARLDDGFALYMLRVEDWYWLYNYWIEESDPNDFDQAYGLDWEIIWRALE